MWKLVVLAILGSCQRDDSRRRAVPSVLTDAAPAEVAPLDAVAQPPTPTAPPRAALPPLPDPLPGKRRDLTKVVGAGTRVALGDLDGDGKRELVVADGQKLRVHDAGGRELASQAVGSGIQLLSIADLDGDKRGEILAGWGVTRDHMQGKATFTLHRLARGKLTEELVLAPATSRQDVAAMFPIGDGKLFVAYFDAKYTVTSGTATRTAGGWQLETIASIRMATHYARGDVDGDGTPDLVVGRVYGDDKGVDGDAFVLRPDGSRDLLPVTRGLRSLAVAGGDIFAGDGWHQNYGEHARGLLTWIRRGPAGWPASLIEDTPGQYSIERILVAKIRGKDALVTHGSHYVRVFTRTGDRWQGETIAGAARDVAIGDLDGDGNDEIAIAADKSELVELR